MIIILFGHASAKHNYFTRSGQIDTTDPSTHIYIHDVY